MRRLRQHLVPFLVLILLLGIRYVDPAVLQQLRWLTFDTYQRIEPRTYMPELPVRIVDIDDDSLARVGQWPWPRTIVAQMVERLSEAGAAAIAFDIVFAEPDRSSPEQALELWPKTLEVLALRESAAVLPSHDSILAKAIASAPVVTGFVLNKRESKRMPEPKASFAIAGDDPKPFLPVFSGAISNLEDLETAATGNGAFNAIPELDQVMRHVPLVFRSGEQIYPSLAAEALRIAQGARTYLIKSSGASGVPAFGEKTGVDSIKIGQFLVPTDAHGRVMLHFTKHTPERFIPAWQVLEEGFDPNRAAGQIIFVGTSAPGLLDLRSTPLDTIVPGVEIHAEAVEQILTSTYLQRPSYSDLVELVYIAVLGLLLVLLLPHIGAVWSLSLERRLARAALRASCIMT